MPPQNPLATDVVGHITTVGPVAGPSWLVSGLSNQTPKLGSSFLPHVDAGLAEILLTNSIKLGDHVALGVYDYHSDSTTSNIGVCRLHVKENGI